MYNKLALGSKQGCQMVCFHTKGPNLGRFWRVTLAPRKIVPFLFSFSHLDFYGGIPPNPPAENLIAVRPFFRAAKVDQLWGGPML
jgi:hypothetical protein